MHALPLLAYALLVHVIHSVDGGERAVIFDRFRGVLPHVVGEGTHFLIPWVQRPVIFSVRSKPRRIPVITGSKGVPSITMCFPQRELSPLPQTTPSLYLSSTFNHPYL